MTATAVYTLTYCVLAVYTVMQRSAHAATTAYSFACTHNNRELKQLVAVQCIGAIHGIARLTAIDSTV
jgi:hypothetical protein